MNDKELLTLAAKAAGKKLTEFWNWNPLVDDWDAFRLAVKLNMTLLRLSNSVEVSDFEAKIHVKEYLNDDPYAATRRAIVRAAAEIGKEMKP